MHPLVIIGTGLAGYQLSKEWRRLNPDKPLVLFTLDDGAFYSKPLLSTALTQKKTAETLRMFSHEVMAKHLNATIHTHTRIQAIDAKQKTVQFNNTTMSFDQLVLACGADVIAPQFSGSEQVIAINHLHHYAQFEASIKNKNHITILGAGLIGCEFANDLSNAGFEVHIVAPALSALDRLVPAKIGELLQASLSERNVHWHLGTVASQLEKAKQGEQFLLTLENGECIETDLVLSAIGLKPHLDLARAAGLVTQRGICVNAYLETSEKDIYALGDCAEVNGHFLPYIAPILAGTRALAKTLQAKNASDRTAVIYPPMPIIVKTPAHPIVICPPYGQTGEWSLEVSPEGIEAKFFDNDQQLQGFILTQQKVKKRSEYTNQLSNLI